MGGVSRFSVRIFCFTVPKEFVKEPFCVSENFPDGENIEERKGRVITTVLRKCLFPSSETFRRGTLLCFRKFLILKNVDVNKGGGHHDPRQFFWLTVPKKIVGEPFWVSEVLQSKNFMHRRGKGFTFSAGSFCLTVPKRFVDEPFCVSEIFYVEKC